jgi:rhamnulokinase
VAKAPPNISEPGDAWFQDTTARALPGTAPGGWASFQGFSRTGFVSVDRAKGHRFCIIPANMEKLYVACEFGTQVSRLMLGTLHNHTLKMGELRRFATPITKEKKALQWNIPALFQEVVTGLTELGKEDVSLAGISCHSWGGDYLLFDKEGAMLSPAFHHHDPRSAAGANQVLEKIPAETIYEETGVPHRNNSTLSQLGAETSKRLKQAQTLLPFADGFNHLLGGKACAEASLASTTQLFSPVTKAWSRRLANDLRLRPGLLPDVVPAGTKLGSLRADLALQTKLEDTQIVATCSNELAAALSSLPLNHGRDWAYLRIGSETLLGTEVPDPIITIGTQALGYANETSLGGSTNLYRRTVGLFILEECRRYWIERDRELHDDVLMHLATTSPAFEALIDPTHPSFAEPGDMPLKIQAYCRETGQEIPRKPGQIIRCVLESLALHYRKVFQETEILTGSRFGRVFLFGAGENNLLNHFIVDALQVPAIIASPDAAAIGNVVVQALTLGHIDSLEAAHEILRSSYKIQAIIPHQSSWHAAAERVAELATATTGAEA